MAATLAEPEKTSGLDTNKKCGTLRCSMGFCQVFIGSCTRNCTCIISCQHYFEISCIWHWNISRSGLDSWWMFTVGVYTSQLPCCQYRQPAPWRNWLRQGGLASMIALVICWYWERAESRDSVRGKLHWEFWLEGVGAGTPCNCKPGQENSDHSWHSVSIVSTFAIFGLFFIGRNMFNCMHAGQDSDQDEMVGLQKQDRSSDAWCLSWNILQNWKTRSNYPRWL